MRRMFLHVGMHKTATTTLQELCARQREWLLERGVFYPSLTEPGAGLPSINHRFVSERVTAPIQSDRFLGFPAYWRAEMAPQLAAHATKNVLLSSEGFSQLALQPGKKRIRALKSCLDGFEVTVVVYLRRQDRWLEAMHNQNVKAGLETRSLAEYVTHAFESGRADYAAQLDFWALHFGARNVSVRVFDPARLRHGDVVADFCHAIGIDDTTGLASLSPRNERLSPRLVDLKRSLNAHLRTRARRKTARYVFTQLQRVVRDPGGQVMPDAMATRIMRDVAAGNADVARRFLGREDGALFGRD